MRQLQGQKGEDQRRVQAGSLLNAALRRLNLASRALGSYGRTGRKRVAEEAWILGRSPWCPWEAGESGEWRASWAEEQGLGVQDGGQETVPQTILPGTEIPFHFKSLCRIFTTRQARCPGQSLTLSSQPRPAQRPAPALSLSHPLAIVPPPFGRRHAGLRPPQRRGLAGWNELP